MPKNFQRGPRKKKEEPQAHTALRDLERDILRHGSDFVSRIPSKIEQTPFEKRLLEDEGVNTLILSAGMGPLNIPAPDPGIEQFEYTALQWLGHGATVDFLMKTHPDDLAYLQNPEVGRHILTAQEIYRQQLFEETRQESRIEQRTNELLEMRGRKNTAVERASQMIFFGTPLKGLADLLIEPADISEEDRAAAREQALQELRGEVAPQQESFFTKALMSPLTGLGALFNVGIDATGNVMEWSYALDQGIANAIPGEWDSQILNSFHPAALIQRAHEEAAEIRGEPEDFSEQNVTYAQARQLYGDMAWQELMASGDAEEFMVMGLGDPTVAEALFQATLDNLIDQPTSARQQITDLEEIMDSQLEDQFAVLEEHEFSVAEAIREGIAFYGHNVPMRLATYASTILSEEDMMSVFTSDGFREVHEEALKSDFSPAKQFGIDGTFSGFLLDFGGGIAFDPATWVWGPRVTNGGISSARQATRIARSPVGKQILKDAFRSVQAGRPELAVHVLLNSAGDLADDIVRVMKDAPDATAALDKALPILERAFKRGDGFIAPQKAMLGSIVAPNLKAGLKKFGEGSWLKRYFTSQNTGSWWGMSGHGWKGRIRDGIVRIWGDDLDQANLWLGKLREAIDEVEAPASGYVGLLEDLKTSSDELTALEDLVGGLSPEDLRARAASVVDDTITRRTELADLIDSPDDFLFHGRRIPGEEPFGRGGVSQRLERAEDFARNQEGVDFLGEAPTEGEILAFRRADVERVLPDEALERLAAGQDIESLAIPGIDDVEFGTLRTTGDFPEPVARLSPGEIARLAETSVDDLMRQSEQAVQNVNQLLEAVTKRKGEAARIQKELDVIASKELVGRQKIADVIEEMYNEYNRNNIATNPLWKKHVDPETGLVPWEKLRSGVEGSGAAAKPVTGERQFIPTTVRDSFQARHGLDPEKVIQDIGYTQNDMMGVGLPLAPIDLIAASELGGAAWTRFINRRFGHTVREAGAMVDRLWKMDKVFRFSTSLVVTADELVRIFQLGGTRSVLQWIEDHVMLAAARAKAPFSKVPADETIGGLGNIGRSRAVFKNKRWAERMQRLESYPTHLRQVERQFAEIFDQSWDDIMPGTTDYLPAANRFTANLLQDSGFRAFLRGRDEFAEWWATPDAAHIRSKTVLDWGDGVSRLADVDTIYDGFRALYEDMILANVKADMRGKVASMWRETAKHIDDTGEALSLPEWALQSMEMPIRGVRNMPEGVGAVGRLSNEMFDWMFMDPTNYRRGFLAEMVRKAETDRLMRLYESQGIRVVPDTLLDQALGMKGISATSRLGMAQPLEALAEKFGIVPRSKITRLVEDRVAWETEHVMYSWHQTSRAGRSIANRTLFPFGKPYADMWAFYGREALTRPALRGWINNSNLGKISDVANAVNDFMPVNPKPLSFVSRTAALDFDLEEEGLDFSPLLFLPKEGENAFWSVLPGLGFVPMWAMDFYIQNMYDPIRQPEQHQQLVNSISQFIPAVGFQQVGAVERLLGGGTSATLAKGGVDLFSIFTRNTWHEMNSILGDIQGEIRTNRALKGIMANPQEWEDLQEMVEDHLPSAYQGILGEAYQTGAGGHFGELAARWFVPARFDFDPTTDQVNDVWLTAADKFPELAPFDFRKTDDEKLQKQFADDIRRNYFNLPKEERDMLLVKYPQLAVNMISGWEWTDRAVNEFPERANTPYRSEGGEEGLARHQSYIRHNYIKPLQPAQLLHRIIGITYQARLNVAKRLYSETAEGINDQLWEHVVSPEWKSWFDAVAPEVDLSTGRELWKNFASKQDELEELVGDDITFPGKQRAWGESFAQLDSEEFSERFRDREINFITDEMMALAETLDIDLVEGMTGKALLTQIMDVIRESTDATPLASFTRAEWDSYNTAKGASVLAAQNSLRQLSADPGDSEFRQQVRDLLGFMERTNELRDEAGEVDTARASQIREEYTRLAQANPDVKFAWQNVWDEGFARVYGDLDWTPPTPPSIEDNPNAYRPHLWEIVDGDTLVVSETVSAPLLDMPGRRGLDSLTQLGDTTPKKYKVRLLGVNAKELPTDEGVAHFERLAEAIIEAYEQGLPITLVRDPDQFGTHTDFFGRELAWLYIGDEPWYFEEDFRPGD